MSHATGEYLYLKHVCTVYFFNIQLSLIKKRVDKSDLDCQRNIARRLAEDRRHSIIHTIYGSMSFTIVAIIEVNRTEVIAVITAKWSKHRIWFIDTRRYTVERMNRFTYDRLIQIDNVPIYRLVRTYEDPCQHCCPLCIWVTATEQRQLHPMDLLQTDGGCRAVVHIIPSHPMWLSHFCNSTHLLIKKAFVLYCILFFLSFSYEVLVFGNSVQSMADGFRIIAPRDLTNTSFVARVCDTQCKYSLDPALYATICFLQIYVIDFRVYVVTVLNVE